MPLEAFTWDTGSIAIVAVMAVPIVLFASMFGTKMFQIRSDNELKRRMIDRGMSADEIERVLAATSDPDDDEV